MVVRGSGQPANQPVPNKYAKCQWVQNVKHKRVKRIYGAMMMLPRETVVVIIWLATVRASELLVPLRHPWRQRETAGGSEIRVSLLPPALQPSFHNRTVPKKRRLTDIYHEGTTNVPCGLDVLDHGQTGQRRRGVHSFLFDTMTNESATEPAEKENSCDSAGWLTTTLPTPCPNKLDNDPNDGANNAAIATANHPTIPTLSTSSSSLSLASFVRDGVGPEICKKVIRAKLAKQRHLVIRQAIDPTYLDTLFPQLLQLFDPQTVHYNGGIAQITEWKISCYVEVMPGGIPTAHPNTALLQVLEPLLEQCNHLFLHWYRQQHACNNNHPSNSYFSKKRLVEKENQPRTRPDATPTTTVQRCQRLMTFVTRYTPQPGEQALLKVRSLKRCAVPLLGIV